MYTKYVTVLTQLGKQVCKRLQIKLIVKPYIALLVIVTQNKFYIFHRDLC